MSIQIIDGFQVNTALPIDNRIVASGSAARNDIPYKYHGLRVFDISDSVPYVWNGSSWVSENSSGIVGSGTLYYFPIFSSSNVITNSLLYEYNGIIKTADNGNGDALVQINPEDGKVTVQGGFFGPGTFITQINGFNINDGSIPVSGATSKLTNGSTGQVLLSGNSFTSWTNQSLLSVGTASSSTNSRITRDSTNNVTQYLTFISSGAWAGVGSGNEGIRSNHIDLTYVPGTRTLSVGTVSIGTGVKFSSVQQKSSDLNTLDDYEEGTWSPIITGTTGQFTIQSNGQYTKIGRLLHLSGVIKFTSVSSCSGTPLDNYINLSAVSLFESSIPTNSAAVGVWSSNPSTSTFNNRLFSGNVYSGSVIISNQVTGNSRMYFTHNGDNPLGGCLSDVISFNITIHNTN